MAVKSRDRQAHGLLSKDTSSYPIPPDRSTAVAEPGSASSVEQFGDPSKLLLFYDDVNRCQLNQELSEFIAPTNSFDPDRGQKALSVDLDQDKMVQSADPPEALGFFFHTKINDFRLLLSVFMPLTKGG